MIAIMSNGRPVTHRASSAPTVAEGSVERIVIGWILLSYRTPSTMYMVTIAASTSSSVLERELRNARAAPWKRISTASGNSSAAAAISIALTASPSEAPSPRLKEIVTAGNWPTWLMSNAVGRSVTRATLESGTGRPERVRTKMPPSAPGPVVSRGSTSSTTRYWLVCVNNVETCRWPKAL